MPYGVSPTPTDLLQSWSTPDEAVESSLKLPGPNVYIPDDFSLVCDKQAETEAAASGGGAAAGSALEDDVDDGNNNNNNSNSDDEVAVVAATAGVEAGGIGAVLEESRGEGFVCVCVLVVVC